MIQIKSFVFNPFLENTYVLYDESKNCVVIDPGCYEDHEKKELSDFIDENNLNVEALWNTHCHIDHVLGNAFIKDKYNVNLHVHKLDEETLKAVESYAPSYGFASYENADIDKYIEENEKMSFGNTSLDVLFLPGHAPGHVAFVDHSSKSVIGGDVLFDGSIGRTDLPGGDFDTLINSIQKKLFLLDDKYIVYPGHGPATTLGKEKVSNPFCAISK